MKSETQSAGRRRRGNRRPRGPRPSSSSSAAATPAPKKQGFLEKIFGFFRKKPELPGSVYGKVHSEPQTSRPPRARQSSNGGDRPQPPVSAPAPAAPRPPKATRKPELVEVTSPKLYVGNLSFDATESDLTELFSGVGQVASAEVVSHRETQRSKGFAFVTLASVDEARRAVEVLHDKEFMSRRLVVSGAKTNDVRNTVESDSDNGSESSESES